MNTVDIRCVFRWLWACVFLVNRRVLFFVGIEWYIMNVVVLGDVLFYIIFMIFWFFIFGICRFIL